MRNSKLSIYIVTIIIMYSFNFGESIARIMKAEGLVYVKRLGMQTYAETVLIGGSINLSIIHI